MNTESRNRRRYPRRACALTLELHSPGQPYPLRCETTDISPGGCYVKNQHPFPIDTILTVIVWAGETKITTKGIVRTADPALGNGIEFIDIPDQTRFQLETFLGSQEDTDSGSFTIIHS